MNPVLKYILSLSFIFLHYLVLYAQPTKKSEDQLKKQAKEHFANKEYAEALPNYSQLLSLYPKDPNYSYHFGACKLFAEKDKEQPLIYLEYAVNIANVEPEAYFYLGKAYHLNYRFNDALTQYRLFKEKGNSKSQKELLVDRHIQMCESGKNLLSNITDIVVQQKKTLPASDFFRSYELGGFGGKIIQKPDEFNLPADILKKQTTLMYFQADAEILYFSSYGEDGKNGKDIYYVRKAPDGEWAKPQPIAGSINTGFDEDYPFYNPNTKSIYFASNGHNSMGGYDIFKAVFDDASGTWSAPINIDFAINTPADDYLFITDSDEKNAWFASTRESVYGEANVYKIQVDRISADITIIKGTFISDATKAAKITIEDMKNGKVVGVFNTNNSTGEYLLTLPNGGKFKFVVETENAPFAYTGNVDLPRQKTLKQLKQEMSLVLDDGKEKLVIRNLFDESIPVESTVLAATIIKEKASLEVNVNRIAEQQAEIMVETPVTQQQPTPATGPSSDTQKPADKKGPELITEKKDISNEDIVAMAKKDAQAFQLEATDLKQQADVAYTISKQKNLVSKDKSVKAEELSAKASAMSEGPVRQSTLKEATELKREAFKNAEQAVAAYSIAKETENNATQKQKDADAALKYSQEIEIAAQQNSPEETKKKLAELNEFIEKQKKESATLSMNTSISKISEAKRLESDKQERLSQKLQDDLQSLQEDVGSLRYQAGKEKKKSEKQRLLDEAARIEKDVPALQKEVDESFAKSETLKNELKELEKQSSIVSNVVAEIKTADKTSITEFKEGEKQQLSQEIAATETRITQYEQEKKINEPTAGVPDESSTVGEQPTTTGVVDTLGTGKETSADKTVTASEIDSSAKKDSASTEAVPPAGLTKTATEQPADEEPPKKAEKYNPFFQAKLDKQSGITDEAVKEENQAKVYEDWAKAIEKEAFEYRVNVELAKKKSEKKEWEAKAVALEEQAAAKKKIAEESKAKAEQVRAARVSEPAAAKTQEAQAGTPLVVGEGLPKVGQTGEVTTATGVTDTSSVGVPPLAGGEAKDGVQPAVQGAVPPTETVVEKTTGETATPSDITKPGTTSQTAKAKTTSGTAPVFPGDPAIASYSGKYISEEKEIEKKSDEYERTTAQAKLNQQWADDIDKDILALKEKNKTIKDEKELAKREEVIRVLENIGAEKKSKAAEQTKLSREVQGEVPLANYDTYYEIKLIEHTSGSDQLKSLQSKGRIYERWAKTLEREAAAVQAQADTTQDPEEKAALEQRIAGLKEDAAGKRTLSEESKTIAETIAVAREEEAKQPDKPAPYTIPDNLTDEQKYLVAKIEAQQILKKVLTSSDLMKEVYKSWIVLLDTAIEIDNSVTQVGLLEREKKRFDKLLEDLKNKEALSLLESKGLSAHLSDIFIEQASADMLSRAEQLKKEADSLHIEAIILHDKAKSLWFFQTKKKSELEKQAKELERLSRMKMLEYELLIYSANTLNTSRDTIRSSYEINLFRPLSENEKKKAQAAESQSGYNFSEAESNRQAAAALKKKKEKKRITELADSLELEAQLKQFESKFRNDFAPKLDTIEQAMLIAVVIEAEMKDKRLPFSDFELNKDLIMELKEMQPQKNFTHTRRLYKKVLLEADIQETEANKIREDSKNKLGQFRDMLAQVDSLADFKAKEKTMRDAIDFVKQVRTNLAEGDSLLNIALAKQKLSTEKASGVVLPLYNEDIDLMRKVFSFQYIRPEDTLPPPPPDTVKALPDTSDIAVEDKIEFGMEGSAYNDKNPIPLNPKIPKGLFYAVQVGAFRNNIPQDLYKGFAPIMGLKHTEDGLTRYTAGMFKNINTAKDAKKQINNLGYKDAFVVAYYNGQRITMPQAKAIAAGQDPEGLAIVPQTAGDINSTINNQQSGISSVSASQSQDMTKLKGLFYTVQVGVYSREVPASKMFNITPLHFEGLPNGLFRYASGIYTDINTAKPAREKIVGIGIQDAFVTAYYDGKRITLAEAERLLKEKGTGILVNISDEGKAEQRAPEIGAEDKKPKETVKPTVGTETQPVIRITPTAADSGIVFRVQLGLYKGKVPLRDVGLILQYSRQEGEQVKSSDGATVYLSGRYKEVVAANTHKDEVLSAGLKNAKVIAFKDGIMLPLEEAVKEAGQ